MPQFEVGHRWTAHDRTIIAMMDQYLNESDIVKVEFAELELLFGPEDSEVHRDECKEKKVTQEFSNLQLAGSK